jgi:hypothetical protein
VIRDNTVRGGAAGITIGSETSGGIRDVEAYRIHVLRPVPAGIIFKSASTRGGVIENIVIHDMDMQGVATAISITLNWNPSYSYAKMPEGVKSPPDYWRVLTEAVPPEKGLPHFRKVKISDIKAVDAQQAFSVSSYKNSPLENFEFQNLEIDARSAGSIQDADHWTFVNTHIKTADASVVTLKDCRNVRGL